MCPLRACSGSIGKLISHVSDDVRMPPLGIFTAIGDVAVFLLITGALTTK